MTDDGLAAEDGPAPRPRARVGSARRRPERPEPVEPPEPAGLLTPWRAGPDELSEADPTSAVPATQRLRNERFALDQGRAQLDRRAQELDLQAQYLHLEAQRLTHERQTLARDREELRSDRLALEALRRRVAAESPPSVDEQASRARKGHRRRRRG